MEQLENNNDDFSLQDLFPDGDFSSILDTIHFSDGLQLEDGFLNKPLLPFLFGDTENEYDQTIDENTLLELICLVPDAQRDNQAILNEEQFIANSTDHQNIDILNFPVPQQASGNQDGIMYQMCPSAFAGIVGSMSVKQQPKANNRPRYQCDGSRFLPGARYNLMSINLPDLTSISLADNQTLGIVMTIATDSSNPQNQTVVHANDIMYRVDGAKKIAHGCVFDPLEQPDIRDSEKKFPRFSIIYKKCDEYTFDLTPLNNFTMFGPTEKYTSKNKKNVGNAAKGKDFKKDYNLLSYKIIFHLALKQDNVVYISDVTCETEMVDEQKATIQTGKRPASVSGESCVDEESSSDTQISSPSKKFKSSTPPLTGLPVTRISNDNFDFNMDHQE